MTSLIDSISASFGRNHSDDTLARVAWSTISEPGDATIGALVDRLGAAEALEASVSGHWSAAEGAGELRARFRTPEVIAALSAGIDQNLCVITPASPSWPTSLDQLGHSAPLVLWVRGEPAWLTHQVIAVTGGRMFSDYGRAATIDFASALAVQGWTVAASAAQGVDALALRAALPTPGGPIAIAAESLDAECSPELSGLLAEVAANGAVVSERAPGIHRPVWQYRRRNQLLGAFGEKTLVIQAARRSGALVTAETALTLGRPVGVVPGSIYDPANAGSHQLLRDRYVTPITSVEDATQL